MMMGYKLFVLFVLAFLMLWGGQYASDGIKPRAAFLASWAACSAWWVLFRLLVS